MGMSVVKLVCSQFLFLWVVVGSRVPPKIAKPGCPETCGNIKIPYPFGIGSHCSLNEWYTIDCNPSSSLPYLSKLSLQVRQVFLQNQTVIVSHLVPRICSDFSERRIRGFGITRNFSKSPFFFARAQNKLMLFGCGNVMLSSNNSKVLSGCSTMCDLPEIESGCYGTSCCQTSVPFSFAQYQLSVVLSRPVNESWRCSSALLVDRNWLPSNYSDPFLKENLSVPVVLFWTLKKSDISGCNPENSSFLTESGEVIETWGCWCDFRFIDYYPQWNQYLNGECTGNPFSKQTKWKAAVIGVTTSVGTLFLVTFGFGSYKLLKRRRNKRMREKFFKRNGGLLLRKQLSQDDRLIEKTRSFTAKELDKATDKYNENRILGRGGQGIVYKGMLTDGRIVAIKRSKMVDESQVEQFINEVVLLSQVIHKNVVRLIGCCLETEVPLLVYEFIPNGTLSELIHNKEGDEFLTWNMRLRVATEVAGALAYLHSALSVPIYHRDIKSSNILLDEKYVAKVSDFGTSRPILDDKTHVTTIVSGTFGYLDPEYFQSSQFTEKSDVYSLGVVLVELLTRQKAVSNSVGQGEGNNSSLATRFLESMEKNDLEKILDVQVLDQNNKEEVIAVAKLARRCLNLNGKSRPTMAEVTMELLAIKMAGTHPLAQEKFQLQGFTEQEIESISDATSSMWLTTSSASHTKPLLLNTV